MYVNNNYGVVCERQMMLVFMCLFLFLLYPLVVIKKKMKLFNGNGRQYSPWPKRSTVHLHLTAKRDHDFKCLHMI